MMMMMIIITIKIIKMHHARHCDRQMVHTHTHTHTEVTPNRPDIIIKNKKQKTCILIDVAITMNSNVMHEVKEETPRYKS
jgi:hypothetical protein